MCKLLVKVPVTNEAPLPVAPAETPVTVGKPQLYVVPEGNIVVGGLFAGIDAVNKTPLQVVTANGVGIKGLGFTVTVIVKFEPVQLGPIGLTV